MFAKNMRLIRGWMWLVAVAVLVISNSEEAHGKRSYIQRLPNVPADWPAVGHTNPNDDGPLNSFGKDFKAAGKKWTVDLCRKDSDGDGLTNGEELGDPDCVWSPGQTPQRTTGITHPAIPNSRPPSTLSDVTASPTPTQALTAAPTVPNPPMSNPPSTESQATKPAGSIPPWLIAHLVLGIIALGLVLPLGNLVSSFGRKWTTEWKDLHVLLGLLSIGLSGITMMLGLGFSDSQLTTTHGKLGMAWVIFGILQVISGASRYLRIQCLRSIARLHEIKRFVGVPISIALLWTGYDMILVDGWFTPSAPSALIQYAGIHVFVCVVFWLTHSWVRLSKYRKTWRRLLRGNEEISVEPVEAPDSSSGEFHRLQTSASEPAIEVSLIIRDEHNSASAATMTSSNTNHDLDAEASSVRGVRRADGSLCNV